METNAAITQELVCLETQKTLSQSMLWNLQREYYDHQGVEAWNQQVPFYVTSNPYIANCYAQIIVGFILDWLKKHPEKIQAPFYLLEMGTGPGRFSFYLIKKLLALRADLNQSWQFCYVMSDFTQSNITFWKNNEALRPFIEKGVLDFAIVNIEALPEEGLFLEMQQKTLKKSDLINPLMTFANYLFDTTSCDCFYFNNQKAHEILIRIETEKENIENEKILDWKKLRVGHDVRVINQAYYEDPDYNVILDRYTTTLTQSYVLFPLAAFKLIKWLREFSNRQLLMLTSDKAYLTLRELKNLKFPSLAFHGSYSMMVNYDALATYFHHIGGDCFVQQPRRGLKTILFMEGMKLQDSPHTFLAAKTYLDGVSPADYFLLHRRISDSFEQCPPEMLISHLSFSGWDPHIFQRLIRSICQRIQQVDALSLAFLEKNLANIADNFYFMPATPDIFFDIAVFYRLIGDSIKALEYYRKSEQYFGKKEQI